MTQARTRPTRLANEDAAPASTRLSLVALLLANLLPLGLVAAGVWRVSEIVLFYWFENLVVGCFNVLRIATAPQLGPSERIGLGAFFTVHYGLFCLAHVAFLIDVFGFPGVAPGQPTPGGGFPLFDVIADPELLVPPQFRWPLLALVASHGLSFASHYLLGGERLSVSRQALMGRPYGRIVVMHLWLFAGGFLIKEWNAPMTALLVLIVLKTLIDAGIHARLHRPRARSGESRGPRSRA